METLSDMHPSNNYIINGFVSFQKHGTSPLNFIHKVTGAVKQMETLSDMRPSNNYII